MKHLLLCLALAKGVATFGAALAEPARAPLFPERDIGNLSRPVTTSSPEAQRYFNQGLAFLYAFNHDESIRSFQAAAELDPKCAMAWWGIAAAAGPHINFPLVPEPRAVLAWDAIQKALKLKSTATPVERALIDAQAKRYARPPVQDRRPLDEAYAAAMRTVWRKFPKDADVGALFAEALMDLRPWDLWTSDGKPQPGTDEILSVLDATLLLDPQHPQALHLTVHAREASPQPELALPAADRLRDRQPGIGHMVHMPSHIDLRLGHWDAAIIANTKAIAADIRYRERAGTPKGFLWLYNAHNRHMLAFAAMMTGRSKLALQHVNDMVAEFPAEWVQDWSPVADYFCAIPLEVNVRFGNWDAVLAAPEMSENLPISRTLRHGARGIAFAAKGDIASARREMGAFKTARTRVPADAAFGNNTASDILDVAEAMLEGEVLLQEGRSNEGLAALREAVRREDALRYDEPPD
jgi:tetratricopeptide (TPR) repeat protein